MENEFDPIPSGPAPKAAPVSGERPRRRLPPFFWLLLAVVVILVLTGIGFISYYWFLTQQEEPQVVATNAWEGLQPEQILPGVALWSLADFTREQQYRQAMAAEAIETATAATVTLPDLPAGQRLGWLTVLARRQGALGDVAQAVQLYDLAFDMALLDPGLGDHTRANTLLDVAGGLALLREEALARRALDQVVLIAVNSLELSASVRGRLLEDAASVYERLGDLKAARAIRALAITRSAQQTSPTSDPLQILNDELVYPDNLLKFRNQRLAQARAVIEAWIAQNGRVNRAQWDALQAALIDEDLVRSAYYEQQLSNSDLAPEARARLLWDQVKWLLLKRRVADGLFGHELVSKWSTEKSDIRRQLHDAFQELAAQLQQLNEELPPSQQAPALYNLYRNLLIWARIGLYPDADQVSLANALNEALAQWEDANGIFPVADVLENGEVTFRLAVMPPAQG